MGDTKSPSPLKGLCAEGVDSTSFQRNMRLRQIYRATKASVPSLAFLLSSGRASKLRQPVIDYQSNALISNN